MILRSVFMNMMMMVNGDHDDDDDGDCQSPPDHNVILRGCSSKRKMFHVECENHLSGARWETLEKPH